MPGHGRGGPRGRGPHGGPRHMPPPPPPPPHRPVRHRRPAGYGCMGCMVPVIAAAALFVGGIVALLTIFF